MNKATTLEHEPSLFKEAVFGKQAEKWRVAMNEEVESLKKNETRIPTQLPENRKQYLI